MEFFQQKRPVLTVSQLTSMVKGTLEENFALVWVEGEVSNLRTPSSGHIYFTLKDENSQIRVVMFRGQGRFLKFRPEDGLHIILRGNITVYEARGEYQILADYIEPVGAGALQLAFEQLKEKLAKEGLFDKARKRSIPMVPKKVGIITSPTGAAIRDMLHILGRRFANLHILIYPVRVQGVEAPPEIVQGIRDMNTIPDLDAIIVGRGGGSIEDLWAFNDEGVARAIYNSRVPVISAVGHETDFTIADFVADLRAPTPSAAAELVVQNKVDLEERLETLYRRLCHIVKGELNLLHSHIRNLEGRLKTPKDRVNQLLQRLDDMTLRLNLSMRQKLEFTKRKLEREASLLGSLSPLAILNRGYSITTSLETGMVIKEIGAVKPGDRVGVRVTDGEMLCSIERLTGKGEAGLG
ncbi:MAG TPA: exodeoxyribonuclease VII large subunit [Thermodesulfobacteriota bacterium]|nr:exodeoxyribonuclease VII large subunit [Thermodesulfobacteriota bacterium]